MYFFCEGYCLTVSVLHNYCLLIQGKSIRSHSSVSPLPGQMNQGKTNIFLNGWEKTAKPRCYFVGRFLVINQDIFKSFLDSHPLHADKLVRYLLLGAWYAAGIPGIQRNHLDSAG